MLDSQFDKYYQIPQSIRDKLLSPVIMNVLDNLFEIYKINIFEFVIRVMIRDIELDKVKDVLVDEFKLDEERAGELKDELMEKIFAPVVDYLKGEGAEDAGQVGVGEQPTEIIEPQSIDTQNVDTQNFASLPGDNRLPKTQNFACLHIEVGGSVSDKLSQEYSKFIKSSVYLNAQEFANGLMDKKLTEIKEAFYKAINAREAFKVMGSLMIIARRGVLRHAFEKDERYAEFWKKQLNRDGVDTQNVDTQNVDTQNLASLPGGSNDFLKDPAKEKYLVSFFRFILEKKCSLSENESAMTGVILGALSRQAGELEYQDLAYGDEEVVKYRWRG